MKIKEKENNVIRIEEKIWLKKTTTTTTPSAGNEKKWNIQAMKYQKKRRKKRREREREEERIKKKDNQISDAEISRVCVSVSVQRVSSCVRNAVKFHATHTRTQFIRRFIGFLPALSFVDRPPATSFFFSFSFVCLILRYDRMISSWGNAGGHRWFFFCLDSGSLFSFFFYLLFHVRRRWHPLSIEIGSGCVRRAPPAPSLDGQSKLSRPLK